MEPVLSRSRPDLFLVKNSARDRLERLRDGSPLSVEDMDFRGERLVGADLSGLDLSGFDLSGCDLSGANLREAILVRARLEGTVLFEANLDGAVLASAEMTGADCTRASARQAAFGGARLRNVSLFGADLYGAHLSRADLSGSDMRSVSLVQAQIRDVDLSEVDLSRADLSNASVERCEVAGARFRNTTLRNARVRGLTGYPEADWIGADVRDTDFRGSAHLRRHVADENYLHELRSGTYASRVLYLVWWTTSDCGRSITRWALWCAVLAFGFGLLYRLVPMDYGPNGPTALSPLLYSVATLTTLDEGAVRPLTLLGQSLAVLEATLGYVMLAGLFSIVASFMGRRGD